MLPPSESAWAAALFWKAGLLIAGSRVIGELIPATLRATVLARMRRGSDVSAAVFRWRIAKDVRPRSGGNSGLSTRSGIGF